MILRIGKEWRGPRWFSALVGTCGLFLVTSGSGFLSGAVLGLAVSLAVWLQSARDFVWVRRLGWLAAAAALAIAILRAQERGGIWLACLEQLFFGMMVAITVGHGHPLRARYGLAEHGPAPLFAVVALFAQSCLGAAVHFEPSSLFPHVAGALAATGLVLWAGAQTLMRQIEQQPIRRAAFLLLSLTFSQLLLGMMAYMSRLIASVQQPSLVLTWFPALHAWVGFLTWGAAIRMALLVYRQMHPEDAELAHGGVAIA